MQVSQNVVRLPFDLADIGKASTDEQFGKYYAEIAKVLGSKLPQFFVNEAEVALGLLFEQYKKITEGEEGQRLLWLVHPMTLLLLEKSCLRQQIVL